MHGKLVFTSLPMERVAWLLSGPSQGFPHSPDKPSGFTYPNHVVVKPIWKRDTHWREWEDFVEGARPQINWEPSVLMSETKNPYWNVLYSLEVEQFRRFTYDDIIGQPPLGEFLHFTRKFKGEKRYFLTFNYVNMAVSITNDLNDEFGRYVHRRHDAEGPWEIDAGRPLPFEPEDLFKGRGWNRFNERHVREFLQGFGIDPADPDFVQGDVFIA